jgi:hypothetical protein
MLSDMRTILQILESPDKKYQLILQKRVSLFDITDGTPDNFHLLIINNSQLPIIRNLLKKDIKLADDTYYESSAQAFLNPYGNVITNVQINPQEKHIDVILSRILLGKGSESRYKETKKISY